MTWLKKRLKDLGLVRGGRSVQYSSLPDVQCAIEVKIKRYQAIPAFCTASDKSWVGPGNEASPLFCINYLFALIKLFIVLMNIISNPQLVCTVLRYKSSCACSMDSVLSDYQNWFQETIFEAQRPLWSSQWAINGVNAMATCMIASCDYCYAPLGVSSFLFSVVDKIACCWCSVCPPPIVLRLYIIAITSYKLYHRIYLICTQQKYGKFC